ncbi:hypothetical protein GCM10010208_13580 [Actinomadura livida]|nr:hypothetical protein GCM10010208_13580 [Actinomadura livida]
MPPGGDVRLPERRTRGPRPAASGSPRAHRGTARRANWFLRPGREGGGRFIDDSGSPELYAAEVSGAGPAGTVIAFETGTLHRGTRLTAPRGARSSMHLGLRPSGLQCGQRAGWAAQGFGREWVGFVHRATPRQLQAFGFPPPGHPYWTPGTLAGMALRYPELDLSPWSTDA